MYKVTIVGTHGGQSSTHTVSFRDAVAILEKMNANGFIMVLGGMFHGYILRKGYLTYFLHKLLN
jgi:hypothetical protein